MAWYYSGLQEEDDDDTYAVGEDGEDGEILAEVGEPSEIDDVDWDSDGSETKFGDDYVPYTQDRRMKSKDVHHRY